MDVLWILLGMIVVAVIFILLIAFVCFRMAFYVKRQAAAATPEESIPDGEIYEAFRDVMIGWMRQVRAMPHEGVQTVSFDGLTLKGKYYEYAPGAPIELMFHGYRGSADRDLCGGVQRCFALGHSALIVDQRCSGGSGGNVITFGIYESRDCHSWLEFMAERFGPDARIILTGISMGASTVLMAAGRPLPKTVVGVLADCGYTSAKAIIQAVIRQMRLPAGISYPFVKLGAKLFGHFDPDADAPIEAVKRCPVPVIFFHGEEDGFVPCDMSRENFEACTAPKKLVIIPGADHGLSYPVDQEGYLNAMREFFAPILNPKTKV